jgi:hypothetical protein
MEIQTTMKDAPVEKRDREKRLITSYQTWPCYPVLPMVNRDRRTDGGFPECGIIIAGDMGEGTGSIKVYLKGMYDLKSGQLKPQLEGVKVEDYENVDALLDAGWKAD